MTKFQDGLPVRLIATPRNELHMCHSDEALADVVARNVDRFDYFPVTEADQGKSERIVGLIELVPWLQGETPNGIVRDYMSALSEDNLIGADAGILAFVKTVDRHDCRLVMSGPQISGLVCLADLQKLPVRAALFALLTHAEMTMADAIQREFKASAEWKVRLSDGRRAKLEKKREDMKASDSFIDDILLTEFADKATIIRKSSILKNGKNKFEEAMHDARKLRDNLAHASDYASSREAAITVSRTVCALEHWVRVLSERPDSRDAEPGKSGRDWRPDDL